MQNLVYRRAFMHHHARLFFHRRYFERADRIKVAQPAMRYRTNPSRTARQEPTDRSLGQC